MSGMGQRQDKHCGMEIEKDSCDLGCLPTVSNALPVTNVYLCEAGQDRGKP